MLKSFITINVNRKTVFLHINVFNKNTVRNMAECSKINCTLFDEEDFTKTEAILKLHHFVPNQLAAAEFEDMRVFFPKKVSSNFNTEFQICEISMFYSNSQIW